MCASSTPKAPLLGLRAGDGVANQVLGPDSRPRVVDLVVSGVHEQGESHYELLRAFAVHR